MRVVGFFFEIDLFARGGSFLGTAFAFPTFPFTGFTGLSGCGSGFRTVLAALTRASGQSGANQRGGEAKPGPQFECRIHGDVPLIDCVAAIAKSEATANRYQ